jgi:hypothetical protein
MGVVAKNSSTAAHYAIEIVKAGCIVGHQAPHQQARERMCCVTAGTALRSFQLDVEFMDGDRIPTKVRIKFSVEQAA